MIQLVGVSKWYETTQAVQQVNLALKSRERLAIVGPSGSGKTTLLRLIAGLEIPDEGEIHINGRVVSRPGWAKEPHLRGVGFVFQSPALWPHLTVAQNISFGLQGLPREQARERLQQALAWSRLTQLAHRYPAQLSGGEARRVSLARAIAPAPACLLLDEPLIYLDPASKMEILTFLGEQIRQSGTCIIYVTHDEKESEQICERLARMEGGQLFHLKQAADEGHNP